MIYGLMKNCRRIYHEGSLPEIKSIKAYVSAQYKTVDKLNADLATAAMAGTLSETQQQLYQVGLDCSRTCKTLLDEIADLKMQEGSGRRDAVFVFIKTLRRKSRVNELQKEIHMFRDMLNTSLLSDMRSVRYLQIYLD